MSEHLTDVKVTKQQRPPKDVSTLLAEGREYAEHLKETNVAGYTVVEDLTSKIDRLNADMAWIRRRTGFWGEVPQELSNTPSKDQLYAEAFDLLARAQGLLEAARRRHEHLQEELAREVGTRSARVAEIDSLRRRAADLDGELAIWRRACGLAHGEFAPDDPKNDWQCNACAWVNFGSRTNCGNCEAARPSQPSEINPDAGR